MRKILGFLLCLSLTACVSVEPMVEPDSYVPEVQEVWEESASEVLEDFMDEAVDFDENQWESEGVSEPEVEEKVLIYHQAEGGEFELPLYGVSGFTGVSTSFYDEIQGRILETFPAGTGFYILAEEGNWWKISVENQEGWIKNTDCLVNLPDLLPSIVYDNPYANVCYSCSLGKPIPHVTGERLYEALFYNERLGEEVYLTPVLYGTAKKLNAVQQSALADGYSLLIYECFRPSSVQKRLVDGLAQLMAQDTEVNRALTTAPWSKGWFVSTGVSSHQKGRAVDMTLVEVHEVTERVTGDYAYVRVTAYEELEMPTQFDELSPLAATFSYPVSGDGWKTATYSATMTEGAKRLQGYATRGGLVPLASEWWHFSDSDSGSGNILGDFMFTGGYSVAPYVVEG